MRALPAEGKTVGGALSLLHPNHPPRLMAISISRSDGNILRTDIDDRDDVRAAARLLVSFLTRAVQDTTTFVLDVELDDETGALADLGVYTYDDFADLIEEDEEGGD